MAALPARPWSASRLAVETVTVSMASRPGTYPVSCDIQPLMALAPSMRVFDAPCVVPLTLNTSPRAGFAASELEVEGGDTPGTMTSRF